jgi:hypothetical protein
VSSSLFDIVLDCFLAAKVKKKCENNKQVNMNWQKIRKKTVERRKSGSCWRSGILKNIPCCVVDFCLGGADVEICNHLLRLYDSVCQWVSLW